MVKYQRTASKENKYMDLVFGALNDSTRREILERVSKEKRLTVTEIASPYVTEKVMSLPAISKHIKILGQSGLIDIKAEGRARVVIANPRAILKIQKYLEFYTKFWNKQLDSLGDYFRNPSKSQGKGGKKK